MKHILVNLISYRKYKMKIRSDIFSDNKGGQNQTIIGMPKNISGNLLAERRRPYLNIILTKKNI